jgi:hypothetical protein
MWKWFIIGFLLLRKNAAPAGVTNASVIASAPPVPANIGQMPISFEGGPIRALGGPQIFRLEGGPAIMPEVTMGAIKPIMTPRVPSDDLPMRFNF